jgi:hypothetical protein
MMADKVDTAANASQERFFLGHLQSVKADKEWCRWPQRSARLSGDQEQN